MNRNHEIVDGIYLVQAGYELDMHNGYDFRNLDYSVEERKLVLNWVRSKGDRVDKNIPEALSIEFDEVDEFRFMPRDPGIPFTEDNCVTSFGYWVDEDWAEGVIIMGAGQKPEPRWLAAIDYMSGAVLAVRAASANAILMS